MSDKDIEKELGGEKLTATERRQRDNRRKVHAKRVRESSAWPRHWPRPEAGGYAEGAEPILGLSKESAEQLIEAYKRALLPALVSRQLASVMPRLSATADG